MSDNDIHGRSDWVGGLMGILTFFVGIGLLLLTFKFAYEMFMVRPEEALGVDRRNPVDLARTGESFVGILGRILFLLVMSAVASVIANRGIRLYAESRATHRPPPRPKVKEPETRPEAVREH